MKRSWALVLVLALGGWEPFHAPNADVEAGNRALTEGRYDDALAAYDRAARDGSVDPDGLAYDRGTAELAKANATKDARLAERALDDLKQGQHSSDARVRSNAAYNRGNALLGQDKLDDAVEAYKQALRERPEFDDARTNLELALRRRQKHQQQQQQGQGQGQQGQGQGQQGQGQNQQGQGQGQGQGQPGQPGQGQQQPQQGQGGGSNQQQPQQGQGGGSNQQQQQGQGGGSNQQQPPQGQQGQQNQQPGQQGQQGQQGAPGRNNRGRPTHERGDGQGPRSSTDRKLDDLEDFSRRLQQDGARRRSTGHPTDPERDW
jgi:hypothetical protein